MNFKWISSDEDCALAQKILQGGMLSDLAVLEMNQPKAFTSEYARLQELRRSNLTNALIKNVDLLFEP